MLTGALGSTGQTQGFTINSRFGQGFDIAFSMTGTNSVTLQRLFGSTWIQWGSAYTATGVATITPGASSSTWRFNVGTFDTDPLNVFVDGDYVPVSGLTIQA